MYWRYLLRIKDLFFSSFWDRGAVMSRRSFFDVHDCGVWNKGEMAC